MSSFRPSTHLASASIREFEKLEQADWGGGVSLSELLSRVNQVAVLFLPEENTIGSRVSRVKRLYTVRSFRHYQTSSCIDPPERRGNHVFYGFRHFVQALLLRKLLWEQIPTERIAVFMAGRSIEDMKRMFFKGVEMVVRGGATECLTPLDDVTTSVQGDVETWRHIGVAPGVQLLLHSGLPRPRPAELKEWMVRIEAVLRKGG